MTESKPRESTTVPDDSTGGAPAQSRNYPLGFASAALAPGEAKVLRERPPVGFVGKRILIPDDGPERFYLDDVRTGGRSQFSMVGGAPARAFAEPDDSRPPLQMDPTTEEHPEVEIHVVNRSEKQATFRAAIIGTVPVASASPQAPPSSASPQLPPEYLNDGRGGEPEQSRDAPAPSSSGESAPWKPSQTAAADQIARDARAVLAAPEPGVPKGAARPAPLPSGEQAAPSPPPAPERLGRARSHISHETPAAARPAPPSETVGAAASHTAHETPGGPRSRATGRHQPPPAGTAHTSGETPGAYDGRAMQARMGTRRPPARVALRDLARLALDRSSKRAEPKATAGADPAPTDIPERRGAHSAQLPDFVRQRFGAFLNRK